MLACVLTHDSPDHGLPLVHTSCPVVYPEGTVYLPARDARVVVSKPQAGTELVEDTSGIRKTLYFLGDDVFAESQRALALLAGGAAQEPRYWASGLFNVIGWGRHGHGEVVSKNRHNSK